MEKPSFKSSPWIRGAPHRVFSRDIRRTRWRISLDTGGRPGFRRRDFHVQKSLNPLRCQPMTAAWDMEKPSFKSSPWIRGAPHRVFSRDIRRTRWRISLDTGGRPGFRRRDFHVQKSLNPLRCQPMTVSGLTITRAWRQPGHRQDRMTQKTLSAFRSNGRGLFRFRTATCCRRARNSVWSAARSAKISMILCMPERVSGGDAKFQGFCDGWNKWEGQVVSSMKMSFSGSRSG